MTGDRYERVSSSRVVALEVSREMVDENDVQVEGKMADFPHHKVLRAAIVSSVSWDPHRPPPLGTGCEDGGLAVWH